MKRNIKIQLKLIECDTNTGQVILQTNTSTFSLISKDFVNFIQTASSVKENKPPVNNIHIENSKIILEHLNTRAGRSFELIDKNLKFITARLYEGEAVQLLKQVIDVKVWEWKDDPEYKKYLRPETLFNATKFQSYKQQVLDIIKNPQAFTKHVKAKENERISKSFDPLDSMYSEK